MHGTLHRQLHCLLSQRQQRRHLKLTRRPVPRIYAAAFPKQRHSLLARSRPSRHHFCPHLHRRSVLLRRQRCRCQPLPLILRAPRILCLRQPGDCPTTPLLTGLVPNLATAHSRLTDLVQVLRVPVVHAAQIQGDVKHDDFSAHLRKVLPFQLQHLRQCSDMRRR